MDGYGGYYAKSNKPDRGRKILHDITCTWNLKKYNKLVITSREREVGRGNIGEGN